MTKNRGVKNFWDGAEDALAKQMWAANEKALDIAAALNAQFSRGRTESAVRKRLELLGEPPGDRWSWSESQDKLLREMVPTGTSYALIAKAVGRTKQACSARAHRLGIEPTQETRRIQKSMQGKINMALRNKERAAARSAPGTVVVGNFAHPTTVIEAPAPSKPDRDYTGVEAKTLYDLEHGDGLCRCPRKHHDPGLGRMAELLYCAAPALRLEDGRPGQYCGFHAAWFGGAKPDRTPAQQAADASRRQKAKARGALPKKRSA